MKERTYNETIKILNGFDKEHYDKMMLLAKKDKAKLISILCEKANCSQETASKIAGHLENGVRPYPISEPRIDPKYQPKCPTCGSPDIKSISGTKRFLTTGLFGLASSNVGKTRECKNCGYKW